MELRPTSPDIIVSIIREKEMLYTESILASALSKLSGIPQENVAVLTSTLTNGTSLIHVRVTPSLQAGREAGGIPFLDIIAHYGSTPSIVSLNLLVKNVAAVAASMLPSSNTEHPRLKALSSESAFTPGSQPGSLASLFAPTLGTPESSNTSPDAATSTGDTAATSDTTYSKLSREVL